MPPSDSSSLSIATGNSVKIVDDPDNAHIEVELSWLTVSGATRSQPLSVSRALLPDSSLFSQLMRAQQQLSLPHSKRNYSLGEISKMTSSLVDEIVERFKPLVG